MPGFHHCSWCHGKGCMCCDTEEAKWNARERERIDRESKEDPRAKLARLEEPMLRSLLASQYDGTETIAELDRQITAAKAACDAQYAIQFPDGPTPIFAARTGNAKDMELLVRVFHADRLTEAFGSAGGGIARIEEAAAKARGEQEPPYEYRPIGKGER